MQDKIALVRTTHDTSPRRHMTPVGATSNPIRTNKKVCMVDNPIDDFR